MLSTEHNKFFGWINTFKFTENSMFFGEQGKRPPYPPIIPDPIFKQVLFNWNLADTGLFCAGTIVAALLARRTSSKVGPEALISTRKTLFYAFFTAYLAIAGHMALVNSYYRLVGATANGLKWADEPEPELRKYDFSSEFVEKSFWKRFYDEKSLK